VINNRTLNTIASSLGNISATNNTLHANLFLGESVMTQSQSQDERQDDDKYNPEDNPGTKTKTPTTDEGNTPLDERYRMTGQESGTNAREGAEAEAPGGEVTRPGLPNQGTDSR
jgi:hypothetical protein